MPVSSVLATTYDASGGSSARNTESSGSSYVYDPTTGTWIPQAPSVGTPPSSSSQDPENVPSSSTGNESSSQVDSKTESDKEYIEIEFNTLVGELAVTPSKKNIRIRVNNTIELSGVGSHLSGKYFVSAVKRTLNTSGYSQTLTVIKNGFGDSLKKKVEDSTETTESRSTKVEKSAPALAVGDSVKIVGKAIFITGDVVPAWVKDMSLTIEQISSDGTRVLLMPISSWTYSRYVQKV